MQILRQAKVKAEIKRDRQINAPRLIGLHSRFRALMYLLQDKLLGFFLLCHCRFQITSRVVFAHLESELCFYQYNTCKSFSFSQYQ